jgi:hypothetical protein
MVPTPRFFENNLRIVGFATTCGKIAPAGIALIEPMPLRGIGLFS